MPHSSVSRVIQAPRSQVYQAFLDPQAVGAWMAPGSMRAQVHTFEARLGGAFRISLQYQNPADQQRGKTTGDTDTYHGRFVALVPDEKIVEAIEFETTNPGMMGEMTMTATLKDVPGGTEVTMRFDHLPAAVRPEDNEEGTRQSLAN
jgi:uncharacterized protein YndB with AHSA1/START domain